MGEMIQRLKRLDRMRPSPGSRAVLSAEEVVDLVIEIEDLERRVRSKGALR